MTTISELPTAPHHPRASLSIFERTKNDQAAGPDAIVAQREFAVSLVPPTDRLAITK
jgi:hypothetical protein